MEKSSEFNNLSQSLINNSPFIIKDWEEQVRSRIKNSRGEDSSILIDHLPELIKNIAESLNAQPSKNIINQLANKSHAREHGKFRADSSNFSLSELIKEYSILRDVILNHIFKMGSNELDQIKLLHSFIDEAIQSSVVEFTEFKDTSLRSAFNAKEVSHQQLIDFFMQAPLAVAILKGPEHRYDLANPPYQNRVRRELIGKTVSQVFSPTEAKQFKFLLDRVYQQGKSFSGSEASIKLFTSQENTEEIWINYFLHPFKDQQNQVIGVMVLLIDVTELVNSRKIIERREAEIANQRFKLHSVFEKSPAAMALWRGEDLVFENINPAYQNIYGNRELLNRKLIDALPETCDQGFINLLLSVLKSGESFSAHEALTQIRRNIDGPLEDLYFDFTCVQIPDAEGRPYGVLGHTLDVTERVLSTKLLAQNKEELQNYIRLLEGERELREKFVAALSHDLRTPLTSAQMSAQVLLRKADDPETVQKMSHRIAENMDRADKMIRDILDASRIKAGEKITLKTAYCEINPIIHKTIENLTTIHGDRFQILEEKGICGHWDGEALQRIIENLVSNAVKYGRDNTPVTISLKKNQQEAELSVHNMGNPLSKEEQEYIFRPYKRLDSTSQQHKGWGMGLTLISGFVEAHGGKVSVRSSQEEGTTFTVTLPR